MATADKMATAQLNAARTLIKEINFTSDCTDHDDSSQNVSHQNPMGQNPQHDQTREAFGRTEMAARLRLLI
jgi:hypothetical protein